MIFGFFARSFVRHALSALAAVALAAVLSTPAVFAEASIPGMFSQAFSGATAALGTVVVPLMIVASNIVIVITLLVAGKVGELMTSQYIFGDTGMQEILRLTWTVFRNFVNVTFVAVMIIVAFMIVVGVGAGKKWDDMIKKLLVQLVIALIGINLTFFGARVVLTLNDVLATVIFTLPSSVSLVAPPLRAMCDVSQLTDATNTQKAGAYQLCQEDITKRLNGALQGESNRIISNIASTLSTLNSNAQKDTITSRLIQNSFSSRNAVFAMVNYMYSLTNILSPVVTGSVGSASIVNAVLVFITSGAIFLVILAMFVVFLARVVFIWLFIAVSPLVILLESIGDLVPGAKSLSGALEMLSIKKFVEQAFLPSMVAFPISVGFIFLLAGLSLNFDPNVGIEDTLTSTDMLNRLMWLIAALLILWTGTFKALDKAAFGKGIVNSIKGVGTGAVKIAGDMAKNAQIIPVMGPLGRNKSFRDLEGMAEMPQAYVQARAQTIMSKYRTEASAAGQGDTEPMTDGMVNQTMQSFNTAKATDLGGQGKELATELAAKMKTAKRDAKLEDFTLQRLKEKYRQLEVGQVFKDVTTYGQLVDKLESAPGIQTAAVAELKQIRDNLKLIEEPTEEEKQEDEKIAAIAAASDDSKKEAAIQAAAGHLSSVTKERQASYARKLYEPHKDTKHGKTVQAAIADQATGDAKESILGAVGLVALNSTTPEHGDIVTHDDAGTKTYYRKIGDYYQKLATEPDAKGAKGDIDTNITQIKTETSEADKKIQTEKILAGLKIWAPTAQQSEKQKILTELETAFQGSNSDLNAAKKLLNP